jgi:SAM-dependent methyltransferase
MNSELKQEYDRRYMESYRDSLEGYEVARWEALDHFFTRGPGRIDRGAAKVLDYGAGSGLFVPLWRTLFPKAELSLCDISTVARDRFMRSGKGKGFYGIIDEGKAPFANNAFDLVISIEVMEHAEKLAPFISEIFRVLKPGGSFVWTTPCANLLSIEQIYAFITRQKGKSATGEVRWKWEDSGHLRRLKSREAAAALQEVGFRRPTFRYRAHLFSFWATRGLKHLSERTRERTMALDYRLFRILPNGASMIGRAQKPESKAENGLI